MKIPKLYINRLIMNFFFIWGVFYSINFSSAQTLTKEEAEVKVREKVQTLNFSGKKDVADLLTTLSTYPNLLSLDLSNSPVQNEDLVYIENPRLSYLNLNNTLVGSEGISAIGKLSQLKTLNLEGTHINNAALSIIARLNWLEKLDIGKTHITDAGIKSLHNSKLSYIDLTSLKISDESMETINTMENLKELHLWNTKITSKGLDKIQNLKNLKVLTISGSEIGNDGLSSISKLTSLKLINLSWTKITDEGLRHLIGNPSIEALSLNGTKITSSGIKSLSKMKKLKILTLEDIPLTNDYEDNLAEIPHLKVVYLNTASTNKKSINSLIKKIPWSAVFYNNTLMMDLD